MKLQLSQQDKARTKEGILSRQRLLKFWALRFLREQSSVRKRMCSQDKLSETALSVHEFFIVTCITASLVESYWILVLAQICS